MTARTRSRGSSQALRLERGRGSGAHRGARYRGQPSVPSLLAGPLSLEPPYGRGSRESDRALRGGERGRSRIRAGACRHRGQSFAPGRLLRKIGETPSGSVDGKSQDGGPERARYQPKPRGSARDTRLYRVPSRLELGSQRKGIFCARSSSTRDTPPLISGTQSS